MKVSGRATRSIVNTKATTLDWIASSVITNYSQISSRATPILYNTWFSTLTQKIQFLANF